LGWRSAAVRIGVSNTGVRKLETKSEDRRIRPAGLFAHQKSLVPQKESKCINVGNREGVLLGARMAPKPL
jgi:hypothetical protein